jgi:hypothetical protein
MKGQMVLEYPFNIFIYIVVILVVIGLIANFRNQILTSLNLCQFTPQGCQQQEECSTIESTETAVNEAILNKYCNFCWEKTGKIDYKKDCLCYVVSGSFSPFTFTHENCELKCNKSATAVMFTYDARLKKVYIKC